MYVGTHKSGFSRVVSVFDLLPKEMEPWLFLSSPSSAGEAGQCLDFICLNTVVIKESGCLLLYRNIGRGIKCWRRIVSILHDLKILVQVETLALSSSPDIKSVFFPISSTRAVTA